MIAIIDYGMGNLRSVWKAFESVGHQALVTRDPAAITNAGHVVLPVWALSAIVWPTWSDLIWLNPFDQRFNQASPFWASA